MNGEGQCAQARQELGVYLLGAIEPAQRAWLDRHLASCPRCRAELAGLAGLPALLRKVTACEAMQLSVDDTGHLAPVFAIRLMISGSHPGYDGVFDVGPFAGKTVNIKTYRRHESVLDISPHPCDYYLVLTGPPGQARVLPWVIDPVFLFRREQLLAELGVRGVKSGVATSVRKADWEAARIFPPQQASPLQLSKSQLAWLALFSPTPAT